MWDMCSGEQDPCFSCGQANTLRKRADPALARANIGWGVGGAQSTVAHKRISPPHKDSGPLLSLTRATKRVTFVRLGGRRGGCVATVQAGGKEEEEEVTPVGPQ